MEGEEEHSQCSVPPPSPLTGCYLLVVVGEPRAPEHKEIILQRIVKGLLSWDSGEHQVDLEKELATLTAQAPEGEEARYGERLIQFASENLVTEILIHPQMNTLMQCMRNLLSSFTRHRHLVHAGYTSAGNGSWIMQDGTFSLADFIDAYQENEVQRVIRAYENSISIDIHCSTGAGVGGEWMKLPDLPFVKYCKIRVNPTDILDSGCKAIKDFIAYLEPYIIPASLEQLLVASDVVGSIRFSHPTLYVFPGGQGDAALFGINGFNMLVDGGFSRKACWWDFARHLDRLDAVLFTRLNNCSVAGMSAVLKRKAEASVYPQIGHFFCNLEERRCASPDGDKDCDPLLVSPLQQGAEMMADLRHINLKPQHCYRSPDPVNLYHKVGHGTLDMYVLNPSKDSKHVREFLKRWHSSEQKLFEGGTATGPFSFPIPNLVSICALLVWRPANPDDNITRIMFPGSTPQHKIFEGLEKLKHLEFLHYPTITGRRMSTVSSQIVSATKTSKTTAKIVKERDSEKTKDEILSSAEHFPSKISNLKDADSRNFIDNKLLSEIADNEKSHIESLLEEAIVNKSQIISDEQNKYQDNLLDGFSKKSIKKRETFDKKPKYVNKSDNTRETKAKQISSKKIDADNKTTIETKKKADNASKSETVLSSTRSKYSQRTMQKTIEKKSINITEKKQHDKKSPPETPKKQTDTKLTSITQITAKDKEIQKSRTRKLSPGSTSGKSTKEANNRRVAESKYKQMSPKRESSVKSIDKKDIKSKREPISRRPRPISSPIKGLKHVRSPTKTVKSTKVDPKLKGMQRVNYEDILMEAKKSDEDTSKSFDDFKQQELDEKEEQEIVKEIEAVFNKDSETEEKQEYVGHSDIEKITYMLGNGKTTLDGEFEEEYLIIEKEEVPPYSNTAVLDTKLSTQIDSPKTNNEGDAAKSKENEKKQLDSKEHSISLEEKQDISSEKKTSDSKNEIQKIKLSTEHILQDSQPDEKISTTIESGATTASTLPEDERITLDEIKEEKKTEEKLDSDLHKEFVPPTSLVDIQKQPLDKGNKVESQRSTIRDVVKTPDEVADLPLHEEADFVTNEDKKSPACELVPKLKSAEFTAHKIPSELHLQDKDAIQSDVVIKTVERMSHAEIVTVTPGSAPESPMYSDAKKITAYSDKPKRESGEETYGFSQFTEKLRETHITTIDSPIKEEIESVDGISCLPEKIPSIPEDVEKEIEEETKLSLTEKKIIVSPKDVEKIVVDVAEVLKSEKTLDEIIKSPNKSLKSPVTGIVGISDSVSEIDKQAYTENLTKTIGKQSLSDNIQHDSIVKTQKDISPARSVTSEDLSDTSAKTVLSETKKTDDLNTNYEHKLHDDKLEKKMGVTMESAKTLEKLEEKICELKKTTDEKICAPDYETPMSLTLHDNESALADDASKGHQNEVFEKDVTHKEIEIIRTSTIGRDGENRVGRPIELPINQDESSNIKIADSEKGTEVSDSDVCSSPPLHKDINQVIQNDRSSPEDKYQIEINKNKTVNETFVHKFPESFEATSTTKEQAIEIDHVIEKNIEAPLGSSPTDTKYDERDETSVFTTLQKQKSPETIQVKSITKVESPKVIEEPITKTYSKKNEPEEKNLTCEPIVDEIEFIKEDEKSQSKITSETRDRKASVSFPLHEDNSLDVHHLQSGNIDTTTGKSELVKEDYTSPIETIESEINNKPNDHETSVSLSFHENRTTAAHDTQFGNLDDIQKETDDQVDLMSQKHDLPKESKPEHKIETPSPADTKSDKREYVKKDEKSPIKIVEIEIITETPDRKGSLSLLAHEDKTPETHDAKLSTLDKEESNEYADFINEKYDETRETKTEYNAETSSLIDMKANESKSLKKDDTSSITPFEDKSPKEHDTKLSFSNQGHLQTSKEETLIDEKHNVSREAKLEEKTPSPIETKDDESNLVKKDEASPIETFESEKIYKTPKHEDQSSDVLDAKSGTTDQSLPATKDKEGITGEKLDMVLDNSAATSRTIDTKGGKSELVKEDQIALNKNVENKITVDKSDRKTSVSHSLYEGKSPESHDANVDASDQSKKGSGKQAGLMLQKHDSPKETEPEHITETPSLIDPIDKEHDIPKETKPEEKTPTSIPIDTKADQSELVKKDEKSPSETVESEVVIETANRKASVSLSFYEDKIPDVNDAELGTIDTKVDESELVKEHHISSIKTVRSEIKIDTSDRKTSLTLPCKEDKSAEVQVAKLGSYDHIQKETDDQADLKRQKRDLEEETKPENNTETPSLIDINVDKSELDIKVDLIAPTDSKISNELFDQKSTVSQNFQEDGIPKAQETTLDSSKEDHQETCEQGTIIDEEHDTLKDAKPADKTPTTSQIDTKADNELVIKDDKSPTKTVKSEIITETPDCKAAVSLSVHEEKSPDVHDTKLGTIDMKVDESKVFTKDHISPIENIKSEISINTIGSKNSESQSFFEIKSPNAKSAKLGSSDQSKNKTDEQADLNLNVDDSPQDFKPEQKSESPIQIDTEVDKGKPDKKVDTASIAPYKSKISTETYDHKTSVSISLHEDKSPKSHDTKLSFSDQDHLETSKEEALKDEKHNMPKEYESDVKTLTNIPIATKTDESELVKKEEKASNETVESKIITETPNPKASVSLSSFEDKSPEAHDAKLGRFTDQSNNETDKQVDLMLQKHDSPIEFKSEQKIDTLSQIDTENDKNKLDKKDDTSLTTPFESVISTETYEHKTSVSISFHEDISSKAQLETSKQEALIDEKHDMQKEAKSESKTLTASPIDTKADESEMVKKEEKSPIETAESEIITETFDRKASVSLLVHEDLSPDIQDEKLDTIDTKVNESELVNKEDLIAPIDSEISAEVLDQKSSVSLTFQGDGSPKAHDIKLSFSDQGHLETSKQEALIDEKHDMQKEAKSESKTLTPSPIDTKADESELVKKEEKSPNETVEGEIITETFDRKASVSLLVHEDISPDIQDEKLETIDTKVNESELVKEDSIAPIDSKISTEVLDQKSSVSLTFQGDGSPRAHDIKVSFSDQGLLETSKQEALIDEKHDMQKEANSERKTLTPSPIDTKADESELVKKEEKSPNETVESEIITETFDRKASVSLLVHEDISLDIQDEKLETIDTKVNESELVKEDSIAPIDSKISAEVLDQKSLVSLTFQGDGSPRARDIEVSFSDQGHLETSKQEALIDEKHDMQEEAKSESKTLTASPIDTKADESELVKKEKKSPNETVEGKIIAETFDRKASVSLLVHEDISPDIQDKTLETIDKKVNESELVKEDSIAPIESKISAEVFDQKNSVSLTFQGDGSPRAHDIKVSFSDQGHLETSKQEALTIEKHDMKKEAKSERKTLTPSPIDTKADESEVVKKEEKSPIETAESEIITETFDRKASVSLLVHEDLSPDIQDEKLDTIDTKVNESELVKEDSIAPIDSKISAEVLDQKSSVSLTFQGDGSPRAHDIEVSFSDQGHLETSKQEALIDEKHDMQEEAESESKTLTASPIDTKADESELVKKEEKSPNETVEGEIITETFDRKASVSLLVHEDISLDIQDEKLETIDTKVNESELVKEDSIAPIDSKVSAEVLDQKSSVSLTFQGDGSPRAHDIKVSFSDQGHLETSKQEALIDEKHDMQKEAKSESKTLTASPIETKADESELEKKEQKSRNENIDGEIITETSDRKASVSLLVHEDISPDIQDKKLDTIDTKVNESELVKKGDSIAPIDNKISAEVYDQKSSVSLTFQGDGSPNTHDIKLSFSDQGHLETRKQEALIDEKHDMQKEAKSESITLTASPIDTKADESGLLKKGEKSPNVTVEGEIITETFDRKASVSLLVHEDISPDIRDEKLDTIDTKVMESELVKKEDSIAPIDSKISAEVLDQKSSVSPTFQGDGSPRAHDINVSFSDQGHLDTSKQEALIDEKHDMQEEAKSESKTLTASPINTKADESELVKKEQKSPNETIDGEIITETSDRKASVSLIVHEDISPDIQDEKLDTIDTKVNESELVKKEDSIAPIDSKISAEVFDQKSSVSLTFQRDGSPKAHDIKLSFSDQGHLDTSKQEALIDEKHDMQKEAKFESKSLTASPIDTKADESGLLKKEEKSPNETVKGENIIEAFDLKASVPLLVHEDISRNIQDEKLDTVDIKVNENELVKKEDSIAPIDSEISAEVLDQKSSVSLTFQGDGSPRAHDINVSFSDQGHLDTSKQEALIDEKHDMQEEAKSESNTLTASPINTKADESELVKKEQKSPNETIDGEIITETSDRKASVSLIVHEDISPDIQDEKLDTIDTKVNESELVKKEDSIAPIDSKISAEVFDQKSSVSLTFQRDGSPKAHDIKLSFSDQDHLEASKQEHLEISKQEALIDEKHDMQKEAKSESKTLTASPIDTKADESELLKKEEKSSSETVEREIITETFDRKASVSLLVHEDISSDVRDENCGTIDKKVNESDLVKVDNISPIKTLKSGMNIDTSLTSLTFQRDGSPKAHDIKLSFSDQDHLEASKQEHLEISKQEALIDEKHDMQKEAKSESKTLTASPIDTKADESELLKKEEKSPNETVEGEIITETFDRKASVSLLVHEDISPDIQNEKLDTIDTKVNESELVNKEDLIAPIDSEISAEVLDQKSSVSLTFQGDGSPKAHDIKLSFSDQDHLETSKQEALIDEKHDMQKEAKSESKTLTASPNDTKADESELLKKEEKSSSETVEREIITETFDRKASVSLLVHEDISSDVRDENCGTIDKKVNESDLVKVDNISPIKTVKSGMNIDTSDHETSESLSFLEDKSPKANDAKSGILDQSKEETKKQADLMSQKHDSPEEPEHKTVPSLIDTEVDKSELNKEFDPSASIISKLRNEIFDQKSSMTLQKVVSPKAHDTKLSFSGEGHQETSERETLMDKKHNTSKETTPEDETPNSSPIDTKTDKSELVNKDERSSIKNVESVIVTETPNTKESLSLSFHEDKSLDVHDARDTIDRKVDESELVKEDHISPTETVEREINIDKSDRKMSVSPSSLEDKTPEAHDAKLNTADQIKKETDKQADSIGQKHDLLKETKEEPKTEYPSPIDTKIDKSELDKKDDSIVDIENKIKTEVFGQKSSVSFQEDKTLKATDTKKKFSDQDHQETSEQEALIDEKHDIQEEAKPEDKIHSFSQIDKKADRDLISKHEKSPIKTVESEILYETPDCQASVSFIVHEDKSPDIHYAKLGTIDTKIDESELVKDHISAIETDDSDINIDLSDRRTSVSLSFLEGKSQEAHDVKLGLSDHIQKETDNQADLISQKHDFPKEIKPEQKTETPSPADTEADKSKLVKKDEKSSIKIVESEIITETPDSIASVSLSCHDDKSPDVHDAKLGTIDTKFDHGEVVKEDHISPIETVASEISIKPNDHENSVSLAFHKGKTPESHDASKLVTLDRTKNETDDQADLIRLKHDSPKETEPEHETVTLSPITTKYDKSELDKKDDTSSIAPVDSKISTETFDHVTDGSPKAHDTKLDSFEQGQHKTSEHKSIIDQEQDIPKETKLEKKSPISRPIDTKAHESELVKKDEKSPIKNEESEMITETPDCQASVSLLLQKDKKPDGHDAKSGTRDTKVDKSELNKEDQISPIKTVESEINNDTSDYKISVSLSFHDNKTPEARDAKLDTSDHIYKETDNQTNLMRQTHELPKETTPELKTEAPSSADTEADKNELVKKHQKSPIETVESEIKTETPDHKASISLSFNEDKCPDINGAKLGTIDTKVNQSEFVKEDHTSPMETVESEISIDTNVRKTSVSLSITDDRTLKTHDARLGNSDHIQKDTDDQADLIRQKHDLSIDKPEEKTPLSIPLASKSGEKDLITNDEPSSNKIFESKISTEKYKHETPEPPNLQEDESPETSHVKLSSTDEILEDIKEPITKTETKYVIPKPVEKTNKIPIDFNVYKSDEPSQMKSAEKSDEQTDAIENHNIILNSNLQADINDKISSLIEPKIYKDNNIETCGAKSVNVESSGESLTSESYGSEDSVQIEESKLSNQNCEISESDQGSEIVQSKLVKANKEIICEAVKNEASDYSHAKIQEMSSLLEDDIMKEKSEFPITCESISTDVFDSGTYSVKENETFHKQSTTSAFSKFSNKQNEVNDKKHEGEESYFEKTLVSELQRSSCQETYRKSATDHELSSLSTNDSGILDHESTICGIHGSSSEDVSKEFSLEEKYSFESNEKAARNLTLEKKKVDTSEVLHFTETKQASKFETSVKKVAQDDSSTLEKRPQAPDLLVSPDALTKFGNSSRQENNQSTLKSMLNQKTSKFEETEQKAHSDEIVQQGIKSEEIQKSLASFTELSRVSTPPTLPASPLARTPTTIQDLKTDEDIESNVLYDKFEGTKETITKVVNVGEDVLTQKISTSAEKVPRTTKSSISDVDNEADLTNLMHSLGKIKTETDTVTKIIKEGENVVTQTITTVTTKEIVSREDGTPQNVKTTIETTTLSKGSDGSTSTITDTQTLLSECSSSLKSSSQMDLYGHEEKEDELCCKIEKEKIAKESDKAFTNKSYLDQSDANENLMIIQATNEYEENIEDTVIDTDVSKRIIKENNCDVMETVTTITKKETLKNDTNKNILRTTVEKNITKERPDGSSNVNKNVDVTIIETLNTKEQDLLQFLDEFAISDVPKEDVSITTDQIEENNFLIDRKIVTTVVTTKYKHKINNSQVMKVETTVSKIDNYPDGNCYSTTNKSTKIICFDKDIEETDSEKQMLLDTNKESTHKIDSCNDEIKNIAQGSDNFTSANIDTVLKDLTSENDAEESETCDVIQIKEKDCVVQRTIKSKIIKTKFCDKDGVPKKLKTVTVVTTTDRYPDGSEKTKIDTKHEISEINDSSVISTALLDYDNLESRSVKEDKYEKTVCRNGLNIQQEVTVKETTEIFTSVASTKRKKKITTETITESHLPDGKIECTKDVNVVVCDFCDYDNGFDMETLSEKNNEVEKRETEPHYEEDDIVEDVTEETDVKNETIKQGQLTIKRTITTKTKRETLPTNDDNLRRVRTTVETTTIDKNPDGSTETTKDVKITVSEFHKTSDFDLQNALRELVPTGKTRTTVDKKQNELKENDIQIIQTITKYTTKEEYLNPKTNEIAVKTVIETITENSKEDGSIKTSKDVQTEVIYLPKGTDLDDWSPENKKEVSCDFTDKDVNLSSKELNEEQHNKKQYYSIGEKITDTSTTVNLIREGDNEITQTITVVTTKEVISPEKIKTTVETTTTSKSVDGKTKTTKSTKTFISDLNESNLAQLESGFSSKSDNMSLDTYEDLEVLPESKICPKTTLEATSTQSTYCSDEEYPESPSSTKSQIAHSPRSNVSFELHDKIGVGSIDNKDLMCTSLYGELPEDDTQSTKKSITKETEQFLSEEINRSGHTKIIEFTNSSFLSEADKHFEKAIEEHKKVSGSTVISNVTAKYELDHGYNLQTEQSFVLKDVSKCNKEVTDTSTSSQSGTQPRVDNLETERTEKNPINDPIESWGKPLGLPSPTQPSTQSDGKGTPKKQTPASVLNKNKINQEKSREAKNRVSDSPSKKKSPSPVYMELTYVPHHGNSYYSAVEFFKRVRARYYVFSGTEPSRDIYNALLDAKKTWENKDLEVTIIPTYDTDVLGYWVTENEEALEKYKIDLSPSASRCTINLQDHETSCAAYRLEF